MERRKRSIITTTLLNSSLVYWMLRIMLKLWSLIPYPVSARIAASLTVFFSRFLLRERMIMDAQIELAAHHCRDIPDCRLANCIDPEMRQQMVQEVFAHMGRVIAEIISIPRLLSTERTSGSDAETFRYIEADHDPLFLELAQTGRGSVVLGAHIGCFELLAAYYVRRGVRLSAIGRLPNYSSVTKLLRAVRSSYGVETIWREESGPKVLIKAIRSNRCIAPLIDQDINLTNVFNPFFGLDSAHPSGPIRLAVKNNLPVFCAWILRLPSNKHKTVVKQIHYDPKSPNAEAEILSEYCARIEQVISQHPEQWLWWHRRWRRRPGVDYTADPDLLPGTKGYVAWLRGTTKNLQESRE